MQRWSAPHTEFCGPSVFQGEMCREDVKFILTMLQNETAAELEMGEKSFVCRIVLCWIDNDWRWEVNNVFFASIFFCFPTWVSVIVLQVSYVRNKTRRKPNTGSQWVHAVYLRLRTVGFDKYCPQFFYSCILWVVLKLGTFHSGRLKTFPCTHGCVLTEDVILETNSNRTKKTKKWRSDYWAQFYNYRKKLVITVSVCVCGSD